MTKFLGTIGFSLFIGALLGLSSTPIISVVIGALSALIGVIVTSKSAILKNTIPDKPINFSILGTFGLFGLVGVLIGLFIRITNPFSPSVKTQVDEWTVAGYPAEEARDIVLFLETGILEDGKTLVPKGDTKLGEAVLFSSDSDALDKLNPSNFDNISDVSAAWKEEGGIWAVYDKRISKSLSPAEQRETYRTLWKLAED